MSLATVKKHLATVLQKTGLANRVQLVRLFSGPESPSEGRGERAARSDR